MDTVFFIASKLIGIRIRADTWIVIARALIVFSLLFSRRKLGTVDKYFHVLGAYFALHPALRRPYSSTD